MNNIIRFAENVVIQERETKNERRVHLTKAMKQETPLTEVGEQVWVGEYSKGTYPTKVSKGEKQRMTEREMMLFARTEYDRGFTEYHYEGNIRLKQGQKYTDKTDPRRGVRDGQGLLKYPLGETYEGEWKNGRRHGKGIFQTPNRYIFAGTYLDDQPSNNGTECFPCGSYYVGRFENRVPEGKGVLLFASGLDDPNAYRYEGHFKDGKRDGSGAIFYPNGDIFSGYWKDGLREGEGVTTSVGKDGSLSQYKTVWSEDRMVGPPVVLEKNNMIPPPKSYGNFTRATTVIPADLTTWPVKDDVDLPLGHFQRIKLGFEALDEDCTGSIPISRLQEMWAKGTPTTATMLSKLQIKGEETVQLSDIFEAWYPNVTQSNIDRHMVQDIPPKELLRFRGILAEKMNPSSNATPGFLQIIGCRTPSDEDDLPMKLSHLENANFEIGGNKFTVAMYETAKNLCDPPHFAEILELYYPNIPRASLERYEMKYIPKKDFYKMCDQFIVLSHNENYLCIDNFEEVKVKFQNIAKAKMKAEKEGVEYSPTTPTPQDPIELNCLEGFFKWEPCWKLGSINLTVSLLRAIDLYDPKVKGTVQLSQILRYCYPNVACKRTRDLFSGISVSNTASKCTCHICALNE